MPVDEQPEDPDVRPVTNRLMPWRSFALACALIFLCRGVLVLSVLPPFEGWDEYQHLAYVVFLQDNGRAPVLGSDTVPATLLEALRGIPQSHFGALQLRAIGALEYDTFWHADAAPSHQAMAVRLPLYQAQHPPLYYRLAAVIFAVFGGLHHLLRATSALRLINVVFGAGAVYMAVIAIGAIWEDRRYTYLTGLLVALNPMFLLNCARVANDALAVMLGTAVALLLLRPPGSRPLARAAVTGLVLGLAVMAKVTALVLLPVAVVAMALWSRAKERSRAQGLLATSCLLAGFMLPTAMFFAHNLRTFGSIVPFQETVVGHGHDAGLMSLSSAVSVINWPRLLGRLYVRDPLWVGGWSYLALPGPLYALYAILVIACVVGCGALVVRRRLRERLVLPGVEASLIVLAFNATTAAGLAYHALQSERALGYAATNGWYGAIALPFLLCLLVQGASAYPGRATRFAIIAGMGALFLGAEIYGTFWEMIPHYTAHARWPLLWDRLAELHPVFPGPLWIVPAVLAVLIGVVLAGSTAMRAFFTASSGLPQ